jgi:aspartate/methionine/tyrosine aminotransferase
MLSKRVNKIQESGIRKIFELAAKNKGEFINLSIGQPDFEVPAKLKALAQKSIAGNMNSYMPTRGYPPLIDKIRRKLEKENNIKAEDNEIIVTSGVSGGIFLLLSSIIDPGDEVIITDPYFIMYKEVLAFLGARIKYLDTYPSFRIDTKKLSTLVSPKTKALILNSPGNPTGIVYSRQELEQIAAIARRSKFLIISDEIYELFDYEKKFFSIGSIYPKTVTLNGYSKSHAITGWRVGYAHGPQEIIEAMNKLQMYSYVCVPSFAQVALAGFSDHSRSDVTSAYRLKRDFVYDSLKAHYEIVKPEGAFYAFIKYPENRPNFIKEAIKNKILIVPGDSFSRKDNYYRVSFAVDDSILEKGMKILKKLA